MSHSTCPTVDDGVLIFVFLNDGSHVGPGNAAHCPIARGDGSHGYANHAFHAHDTHDAHERNDRHDRLACPVNTDGDTNTNTTHAAPTTATTATNGGHTTETANPDASRFHSHTVLRAAQD